MDEGIEWGGMVKVITRSGKVFTFDSLVKEDNVYYGIKNIKGQQTKTIIPSDNVKEVRLHNEVGSTLGTIGIVGGFLGVLLIIAIIDISINGIY